MEKDRLLILEKVNQLSLTDDERQTVLDFFAKRDEEFSALSEIDTSDVERMVHVMPILTVVRSDEVKQNFSREDLQAQAPETDLGYWCVPKVVE